MVALLYKLGLTVEEAITELSSLVVMGDEGAPKY